MAVLSSSCLSKHPSPNSLQAEVNDTSTKHAMAAHQVPLILTVMPDGVVSSFSLLTPLWPSAGTTRSRDHKKSNTKCHAIGQLAGASQHQLLTSNALHIKIHGHPLGLDQITQLKSGSQPESQSQYEGLEKVRQGRSHEESMRANLLSTLHFHTAYGCLPFLKPAAEHAALDTLHSRYGVGRSRDREYVMRSRKCEAAATRLRSAGCEVKITLRLSCATIINSWSHRGNAIST